MNQQVRCNPFLANWWYYWLLFAFLYYLIHCWTIQSASCSTRYFELYILNNIWIIFVCHFVNPCLKYIIFVSVENCGTNRALIFSVVFLIFVDENVCFCFFSCPVQFILYLIKKWGTFLHTISNCFSRNRHYPSHCYPPKSDLVELTQMAGFMSPHCPLNIYDRWKWYTEPY